MGGAKPLASFPDFLAPVTVDQFRRAHLDRAPLHIPGAPDKFAEVMSWDGLNRLLDMTAIWTSQSLQLALDCRIIPPERYCRRGLDRHGRPAWLPQPALVQGLLRQGASVLLNDIDTLSPGVRAVAGLLEGALGAKVQINLYGSWRERQAFPSHFDTHDVFALQIAGEKRWTVYRGRFDQPIAHPTFKSLGQAYHDQARGAVLTTVDLRPGDILYLPRGQYHDALATGAASVHLAVGATEPIGIDLLGLLFDDAVANPAFRRRLPAADAPDGVAGRVGALAAVAATRMTSPEFRARLAALRAGFNWPRGGFPSTDGFRDELVTPLEGPPAAPGESTGKAQLRAEFRRLILWYCTVFALVSTVSSRPQYRGKTQRHALGRLRNEVGLDFIVPDPGGGCGRAPISSVTTEAFGTRDTVKE